MEVDPQQVISKLSLKLAQKEFEIATLEAALDALQLQLEELNKDEGV